MSVLSTTLFHLRSELLRSAETFIPEMGFTNEALLRAIDSTGKREEITDSTLAQMFERGFPSALVEHVVKRSNLGAQELLEAKYNKNTIINAIAKNEKNFSIGRLGLPTGKSVAQDALTAKIAYLHPLVAQWPDAVALEYKPSNVAYTLIGLAEFVDTTAYYMERVDNLRNLLEPARRILNARLMASYIPGENYQVNNAEDSRQSATADFLHSFVHGVPLASGPNDGHSSLSLEWYIRRGKLGVLYCTTVTSLMGDTSREAIETRNLAQSLIATVL